ncbi:hypothetical protein [Kitasatospora sp. McL0602]|uniref:hypothetical protein n=1 Tax=Kitasatospora sp. McL0602 TaxID=3439530 RepID=UPI003F8B6944
MGNSVNLDFSAEPLFSWYVVLLFVSGVAMLAIGISNSRALSVGWRIFNMVAGVGFVGYAVYLGFIFEGGSYIIFFKAFILPVVMVINFFRAQAARKSAPAPAPMPIPMPVQPQPQPQPQDAQPQSEAAERAV